MGLQVGWLTFPPKASGVGVSCRLFLSNSSHTNNVHLLRVLVKVNTLSPKLAGSLLLGLRYSAHHACPTTTAKPTEPRCQNALSIGCPHSLLPAGVRSQANQWPGALSVPTAYLSNNANSMALTPEQTNTDGSARGLCEAPAMQELTGWPAPSLGQKMAGAVLGPC